MTTLDKNSFYVIRPGVLPALACPLLPGDVQERWPRYEVVERLCDVPHGYVEHVAILFAGRRASLFCYEEARVPGKARIQDKPNAIATCLYQNWTRKKGLGTEFPCDALILGTTPPMPYEHLTRQGLYIAGTVGLWLGEMP